MASNPRPYRLCVSGGRDFSDVYGIAGILLEYVWSVDDEYPQIVHGGCNMTNLGGGNVEYRYGKPTGVDAITDYLARFWGWPTPEIYWANWAVDGKRAGPRRNHDMALSRPDLCILFPGGRGTANMERCARAANISVRRIIDTDLDDTVRRRGRKYSPAIH